MGKVNSAAVLLAVIVALTGCTFDAGEETQTVGETAPNVVQPGAPGEPSRTLSPEELSKVEEPEYTAADVAFVQGMIHHHAQALRMAALVPKRSESRDLELMARRMDASQTGEIEQLRKWLLDRDEAAPLLHRVHGHAHGVGQMQMPGMATEAELKALAQATGPAFDRRFLRLMIRHHLGAIQMVQELYAANGGLEPQVDALAREIDSDQLIEIARMEQLLAELDRS